MNKDDKGKVLMPWELEGIAFEEWKKQQEKKKNPKPPYPFFGGPGGFSK